jgi:predicted Fe-Mo cluster-binding NifX family protein
MRAKKGRVVKKLSFLIGLGVGFLLGSKAGTGPYQELETKVRSIANRPDVREAVETTKEAAVQQATDVVSKVSNRIPAADEPAAPSTSSSKTPAA